MSPPDCGTAGGIRIDAHAREDKRGVRLRALIGIRPITIDTAVAIHAPVAAAAGACS